MRKLILENFELEENENNNNKENVDVNIKNLSNDDNLYFNINNNNIKESVCSDSTFMSSTKKENKRTELNEERLKRISNKAQIFDLLNFMENL
jgi:hypothetical protein